MSINLDKIQQLFREDFVKAKFFNRSRIAGSKIKGKTFF